MPPLFYPGFYPGKRPVKKKRGKKPVDYAPNELMAEFEGAISFDSALVGFPKNFAKMLDAEYDQAFKIRGRGAERSGEITGDMGAVEEEYAELPGASGIGLDLIDLYKKDPFVFIDEVSREWGTAIFGFKDISIQSELLGVWAPLMDPTKGATASQRAMSLHSKAFKDLYGIAYNDHAHDFEHINQYATSVKQYIIYGNVASERGKHLGNVKVAHTLALWDAANCRYSTGTISPNGMGIKAELDRAAWLDARIKILKSKASAPSGLTSAEESELSGSYEELGGISSSVWDRSTKSNKILDFCANELGDKRLVAWARAMAFRDDVFRYNELIDSVAEGKFFQKVVWEYIKKKSKFGGLITPAYRLARFAQDPVGGSMRFLLGDKRSPVNQLLKRMMDGIAKFLDSTLGKVAKLVSKKLAGAVKFIGGGAVRGWIEGLIASTLGAAGATGVGALPAVIAAAAIYVGEKVWNVVWATIRLDFDKALNDLVKEITNFFKFIVGITLPILIIVAGLVYLVLIIVLAPLAGTSSGGVGGGVAGGYGDPNNPRCNAFNCFGSGVIDFETSLNCAAATLAGDRSGPLWRMIDEYGPYCDNETRSLPFAYNLFTRFYDLYAPAGARRSCGDDTPSTPRASDTGVRCTTPLSSGALPPRSFTSDVGGMFEYYRGALRDCSVPAGQLGWTTENSTGRSPEDLADYMLGTLGVQYAGFAPPREMLVRVLTVAQGQNVNPWILLGIWGTESWFSQYGNCSSGASGASGTVVACNAPTSGRAMPNFFSRTNPQPIITGSGTFDILACFEECRSYGRHNGIDLNKLPEDMGMDIRSPYNGVAEVVTASWQGSYGNLVVLRVTGNGDNNSANGEDSYYIYFGHMSSFAVSVGQTVNYNDLLGYVGSTGNSAGAHVHLEIRAGGSTAEYAVNPCGVFNCGPLGGGQCRSSLDGDFGFAGGTGGSGGTGGGGPPRR